MEVHLIWAQDANGGIGKNGELPWHISEDLKNFKKLTLNSTIIMGRKTWDSLPIKPLPKRRNIVLSTSKQVNVETYHSYNQCINELKNSNPDKIFIIGGRSIYKLFFNEADYLHLTEVGLDKLGINEFFPIPMNKIKNNFKQISRVRISENVIYTLWNKKKLKK